MSLAILSLGSNLGDRHQNLVQAKSEVISQLEAKDNFIASSIYETLPVDVPQKYSQDLYFNAILAVYTDKSHTEVSRIIHEIEEQMGRVRAEYHDPRNIDIDLIAFGNMRSSDPSLLLPHPEAAKRLFVIAPLAEILPEYILPLQTISAKELLLRLPKNPSVRQLKIEW